jgi:hypothetical protein
MAAASSSKPTAVHYSLIFFVLLSIILGVLCYTTASHAGKVQISLTAKEGELNQTQSALRKLESETQELKKTIGKPLEALYNSGNPADPLTVNGAMTQDIRDFGQTVAESTVTGTMAKMRQLIDTLTAERDSKTQNLTETETNLLALQTRYQTTADDHGNARKAAEGQLRTTVNERDQQIQAKDQQINELRGLYNESQVLLEQEKEAREKDRVRSEGEIAKLILINDKLRTELDDIKQESFEVPDGKIQRVDNVARMVWIDLGEIDFLKPRMTFSVYGKDTPGVARTTADIKGKIEVTRVIGPHLAEAKIIEEDIYRPMSPNDFVYTPLWSPGRPEKFAIVGMIDLDDDGVSDRALFHQEMAVRGADIADEVDDDGNRSGTGINESIKYLIMGSVGDPADVALDEDRNKLKQITDHQSAMRNEARLYGVRIIPLNAFLDYIGYKSKRRLFKPGDGRGYTLKAGAASTATDDTFGDRSSTGNVSGAYGTSRTLPPATSSGVTSKLFGGK